MCLGINCELFLRKPCINYFPSCWRIPKGNLNKEGLISTHCSKEEQNVIERHGNVAGLTGPISSVLWKKGAHESSNHSIGRICLSFTSSWHAIEQSVSKEGNYPLNFNISAESRENKYNASTYRLILSLFIIC